VTLAGWHAFVLSVVAFSLHYLWENIQCPLFFVHTKGDPNQIDMLIATLGDVVLTWLVYAGEALVARRWLWLLESWGWRQWATMLVMAVLMGVAVEWYALETSRWSYTNLTPQIPGTPISVIPVAQLLLLLPLSFGLTRWLLRLRGSCLRSI
jgi:hypothetical protein